MSAGMAGVIAAHVLWEYGEPETSWSPGESVAQCSCGLEHGGWVHSAGGEECPDWDKDHAAHVAEELSKAGYGNVQEAKAEALREVHEVLLAEIYRAAENNLGSSADYALGWERGLEHADGKLGLAAALADPEGHALVQAIRYRKAGA